MLVPLFFFKVIVFPQCQISSVYGSGNNYDLFSLCFVKNAVLPS